VGVKHQTKQKKKPFFMSLGLLVFWRSAHNKN